jgi:hypothetical protein
MLEDQEVQKGSAEGKDLWTSSLLNLKKGQPGDPIISTSLFPNI